MRQPAQGGDRQGRHRVQPGIRAAIGGQHRQRDALAPRQRLDLLDAVLPIGDAADQADQDARRALQRLLDIGIDRQRMFQRRQIGQAQAGQRRSALARPMPARRKGAEIAVGEGQHHQIGRALAQVGRGIGFLQPVAFAEDDMHGVRPSGAVAGRRRDPVAFRRPDRLPAATTTSRLPHARPHGAQRRRAAAGRCPPQRQRSASAPPPPIPPAPRGSPRRRCRHVRRSPPAGPAALRLASTAGRTAGAPAHPPPAPAGAWVCPPRRHSL